LIKNITAMTPTENLHYAIGELAYAIAAADGEIQQAERDIFHDIIKTELQHKDVDFNVTDIIFQVLNKQKTSTDYAYDWAMKQIRLNSHYLSPALKEKFIAVMEKVANAFKPVTIDEMRLVEKFKMDIAPITGDPVYYGE
jgi:uncharacterized tellurite resistance protein B-like protein